ncbi:MAG: carboxyltransferase domain-containing protein [Deltaproteobacteria bacterium]|nr:carboxyltransferase domain-containing protein [Deltaproteobacteria bacterium]
MKVAPFGDAAVEIVADGAVHARRVARAIERVDGVLEPVVGWDRVVAHLCDGADPEATRGAIERALAAGVPDDVGAATREHLVRAIYDGPDLREIAEASGLSIEEVAARHAAPTYVVEVIGFLPGFAYLGGVDPSIARPRRATPRPRVPARSIGVAGPRTAIYPLPSPGGWNLVGRAVDFAPFDPSRTPPARLQVGDRVRFEILEIG